MNETARFRIFFWQKIVPLLALPVFGMFVAVSPVTRGWSSTTWLVAGCVVAGAVAAYVWNAWRRSIVALDDHGVTLYLGSGKETWPYAKLLKVKQVGKYRVRMCFDPDITDKHMHITIDLWRSDAFVDALLDRYEETQGRELPELDAHEQQAA